MDIDELARGLAAGVLTDTVRSRGKGVILAILGTAAVALIGAIAADGIVRGLLIAVILLALVAALVAWLLGKAALVAIRAIGEPQTAAEHRGAITAAIDDADLPTGPVAAARFAWRLRRGHEAEVERLKGVVAGLRTRLDA